jgi:tRNA uracil 4-sulfurtransferase
MADLDTLVLVRLASELALKAPRTRAHFIQRLLRNLKDALNAAGATSKIETEWGRVYVRLDSPAAVPVIGRVFGLSSYSVIDAVVPSNVDAIVEKGVEVFKDHIAGKRFAVDAHRAGSHDFSSKDVEIALGARLAAFGAKVDLTKHASLRSVRKSISRIRKRPRTSRSGRSRPIYSRAASSPVAVCHSVLKDAALH